MAMTLLGTPNFTNALKEVVLPYIKDNYPKETILLDKFKASAEVKFINDEFLAPIRSSRHGGIGNLPNDSANINAASGARVTRGTIAPKIVTGAFNISHMVIAAAKAGNMSAVEDALSFQSRTLPSDFARHLNRQYYSDGVGVISQVLGSVSGTEFSVMRPDSGLDDGRSIDWYGSVNGDINPIKYFADDQVIGLGTAGAVIGTVSALTGTSVQLTGATATVGSDAVFILHGSPTAATAGTAEVQGIRRALSSTTGTSLYAGLARNTNAWTPQFGSVSEALTQDRLEISYLDATEYSMNSDKYVILVNKTLFRKYGDILTTMRRSVNQLDLVGGWKGLEFAAGAGSVSVVLDRDVPDGEALIINLNTWVVCQISDIDWFSDPETGSMLKIQNSIQYQATLLYYVNLFCLAPAANGRETQKTD